MERICLHYRCTHYNKQQTIVAKASIWKAGMTPHHHPPSLPDPVAATCPL